MARGGESRPARSKPPGTSGGKKEREMYHANRNYYHGGFGSSGVSSLQPPAAQVGRHCGCYFILLGILCLVMLISGLIRMAGGGDSGAESPIEVVMVGVVALLGIAYTVYVMLTRCQTPWQRVLLPVVACLLGAGFCLRLLAALVLHVPMESGKSETAAAFAFPATLYDDSDNRWELLNQGGDGANYRCQQTGATRYFYRSDFDLGSPAGFYQK